MSLSRSSLLLLLSLSFFVGVFWASQNFLKREVMTGAPPYGEAEMEVPELGSLFWFKNWQRPQGPPKVGLQVGHWKNSELPEELERLRGSTGSEGGGKDEWEVNLKIAQETAKKLRKEGVEVEILPATIPPSFWADVLVAIHADGSFDTSASGFKIAAPWRDYTGKADDLVGFLEKSYEEVTGMAKDPNISRNMRGYYVFSWWKYKHAVHPMTVSVIVETGFLTSWVDRKLLIGRPEVPAQGVAEGLLRYLDAEGLLDKKR